MPIPPNHRYRQAYHFTLLDNLPEIIRGGLLSPNEQIRQNIKHRSIAEKCIQARRAKMRVTSGPGGVVHDYVPFYFTSLSPMLLAVINAKNVDQHDLIHLAVPIAHLDRNDVVFTNAAANADEPPDFFTDPANLDRLKWDIIDSQKWGWNNDDKHSRMAEMLIHSKVNLTDVDHIIVWNNAMKKQVEQIFADAEVVPLPIEFTGHRRKLHYFTTYWDKANERSIVCGPKQILRTYQAVIDGILRKGFNEDGQFANLWKMRDALRDDMAALPETAELVGLESENEMHKEDVGNHTLAVVRNLKKSQEFDDLSDNDQLLTEVAAFFHDIGKGPKARWAHKGGKQQIDLDHPVKSAEMLVRIFTEEIVTMKKKSVRTITKLVCYHDLVGDILGRSRDPQQLEEIVETEAELDMLIALGLADMLSVNPLWVITHRAGIAVLRERVLAKLKSTEPNDDEE